MASTKAASRARNRNKDGEGDSSVDESAANQTASDMSSPSSTKPAKKTRIWFVIGGIAVICLLIAILAPKSIRSYSVYKAQRSLMSRDYEDAQAWLDWGSKVAPEDGEIEFYRARVFRKLGEFSEFEKSLGRARQFRYHTDRIRRERWLMEAQSGKLSEAERQLNELLDDKYDDSSEVAEAFVSGYMLTGRFSQAKLFLDQWLKDYPDDPQPSFMYGLMYAHNRQVQLAEEQYRKALEIDPDHVAAKLSLGDLLADQREFEKAIPFFTDVIEEPRYQLDGLWRLGTCLRRTGELERAKEILDRALKIDPNHVQTLVSLGQTEVQLERFEDAIKHMEEALPKYRPDPEMLSAYSIALRGVGRLEEAAEQAEIAREATEMLSKADELSRTLSSKQDDDGVAERVEIGRIVLQYGSEQDGLIWLYSALNNQPDYFPAHVILAEHFENNADKNPIYVDRAAQHRAVIQGLTNPSDQAPQ